jgi:hypothetical protein
MKHTKTSRTYLEFNSGEQQIEHETIARKH